MTVTRGEKIMMLVAVLVTLYLLSIAVGSTEEPSRPMPVTVYEDGSVVWSDGTTSCDPSGLCARP